MLQSNYLGMTHTVASYNPVLQLYKMLKPGMKIANPITEFCFSYDY